MNLIDMPSPRDWNIKITFQIIESFVEDFAHKRSKMAEILKIKIKGNKRSCVCWANTTLFISKTLKEIRRDIVSEVAELLPQNFKFVRTGIPVSATQEEKLHLQKCIREEENGKVFSLSIQVHNSLEKKDSREISIQTSAHWTRFRRRKTVRMRLRRQADKFSVKSNR